MSGLLLIFPCDVILFDVAEFVFPENQFSIPNKWSLVSVWQGKNRNVLIGCGNMTNCNISVFRQNKSKQCSSEHLQTGNTVYILHILIFVLCKNMFK